jgi:hypothetical protein
MIDEVREESGSIIDCVSSVPPAADPTIDCTNNAGGWPTYAVVPRSLDPPADAVGDHDQDGYTNLEEWLHGLSEQLQPGADRAPSAPQGLRVE